MTHPAPFVACAECGETWPRLSPRVECPCGGLLEVVHHPRESARTLRTRFDRRRRSGDPPVEGSGVWRFRDLLLPGRGSIVTHPEGNTTLYRREKVAQWVGLEDLALKHEGENPTGSFKDRGLSLIHISEPTRLVHSSRMPSSA